MVLSSSVAQFNTDTVIASYFNDGELLYGLDIGAVDGIFINNTFLLEKEKNAEILCVEANPYYFESLKKNRKNVMSLAVGAENKDNVDFFVVKVEDHNNLSSVSSVSSLKIDKNLLDSHKNDYKVSEWTEKVNVRTMDFILSQWNPPKLDLVSIDVEGFELEILRAWNTLTYYSPKLMVIEANDDNHEKDIKDFMLSNGYLLSRKIEVNLFFTKP